MFKSVSVNYFTNLLCLLTQVNIYRTPEVSSLPDAAVDGKRHITNQVQEILAQEGLLLPFTFM